MREKLAIVNPKANNLENLFREAVMIENLTKRNDLWEYYLIHQDRRNYNPNDPVDVDLYRIKKGQTDTRYFHSHNKNYNEQNNLSREEQKRKGLCFVCGKAGHMQFNCPNRKKPKNINLINRTSDTEAASTSSFDPTSSVRRIKLLNDNENINRILEIIEFENKNFKGKTNILDFYIKTNDSDEVKVKVLIDFGSNINYIHPEFARVNNIKLIKVENPFKVAGLGYSLSTVKKITEKCILRFKNHFEIILLEYKDTKEMLADALTKMNMFTYKIFSI